MSELGWLLVEGRPLAEAALAYAAHGWAVFPCRGKDPLTKQGFKDATAEIEQVKRWWRRWPQANIGWALPPGWFALDEDPRHGGNQTRDDLEQQRGILPPTLRQQTGSGGFHWIFRAPDGIEVRQGAGVLGPGLDTRVGGKGYLIVSPSVHPDTGAEYRWHCLVEPQDPTAWVIERVRKVVEPPRPAPAAPARSRRSSMGLCRKQRWASAALENLALEVAKAPSGTRNTTLNRAAYRLAQMVGGGRLDEAEVRARLREAGLASGLSEREVDWVLR
jgi:bifunctional DNA primase/polymerase-like protein